jgi:hypothetical protein
MSQTVYEGSDGQCYTDRGIWERLESGEWTVFCWDTTTGQEWVITPDEDLLALTPIDPDGLRA